jgi:hypothetical protein
MLPERRKNCLAPAAVIGFRLAPVNREYKEGALM